MSTERALNRREAKRLIKEHVGHQMLSGQLPTFLLSGRSVADEGRLQEAWDEVGRELFRRSSRWADIEGIIRATIDPMWPGEQVDLAPSALILAIVVREEGSLWTLKRGLCSWRGLSEKELLGLLFEQWSSSHRA